MDVSCSQRDYRYTNLLGWGSRILFPSQSYQTLPPTSDGCVLGELTFAHGCDNNPSGASTYIRNCDALIYEGKDVSLHTTLQLTPVNLVRLDGSPALTGHYMVDLRPLSDSWEGRQNIPLSGCRELKPGDILETASSSLLRVSLESLAIHDYDVLAFAPKLDTAPTTQNSHNPNTPDEPPPPISKVGSMIANAKHSFACGILFPHTSDA